jgi:hypothetical protein
MIEEMIGDSVPLKLTIEDLREMGCYARWGEFIEIKKKGFFIFGKLHSKAFSVVSSSYLNTIWWL